MKKRYYILTGILSYLFFTLGNVPAAKVISLAQKNIQLPAKLYGVQGSIWNGSADKVIVPGQPPIENIQWDINPAMLLLAHISGKVKASIKNQNVIGDISLSAGGTLSASNVRARIEAPVMQELIKMPLGELGGVFNLNIESIETTAEGMPDISANIKWKNAKLTLLDTVDLGFINLTLKTNDDNQLVANITNTKGQLLLDGKANIDSTKAYDVNLRITPESSADNNIRQSLNMFAKRQSDGSYLLKRKGNLNQLGL